MTDHKSALLVMDFQNGIVERIADDPTLLDRARTAVDTARAVDMTIIYVTVQFREGFPDVSPNNQAFSGLRSSGMPITENDPAVAVHPAVDPRPTDIYVTKRRVGAFAGSDLEVVLRSQQVDHLVLAGISTSGVVLSTLRLAADMDYALTVLSDCCADPDPTVHDVLLTRVFPRQAKVVTVEEWRASLDAPPGQNGR